MIGIRTFTGAACAALLASSAAFAQVPPADEKNPNEGLPEKHAYTPYGETIKLDQAKKAAAAALAESTKRGWAMCIAVVSPSGELIYFEKMDDCQYGSISIAQHKARAAAKFRRPTLVFERLLGRGDYFRYLTSLDDVIASRGGNPIVVGGKIIGAIGVSGSTGPDDSRVGQAGLDALK